MLKPWDLGEAGKEENKEGDAGEGWVVASGN